MKFSDDFVKQYKKFLAHKNATGEKVPNLDSQVTDFKNAVEHTNSFLNGEKISDLTAEELLSLLIKIHQLACPNLYKTLPQSNQPESPGEFRHDLSLELKRYPKSEEYYQGLGSEQVFGMARYLRKFHPINELDIGLEFLSGYYKIIWSLDFDKKNRDIFKRRVTMDFLTKDMDPSKALSFQAKYGLLAKTANPPQEWIAPYSEISKKLDSVVNQTEKFALEKIFWIRDCKDLREKTLTFTLELIKAVKEGVDPIEVFARFAYRFIHIHPFLNGNSRVMHIILNAVLVEENLPPLFLGNIFSTREELYKNYFHPENEDSILPPFVDALRKAIALEQKELQLYKKTQSLIENDLSNSGWKIYPEAKLTGKYLGHQVRFFTFNSSNKDHASKLFEDLKSDGFGTELKQAPNGNPSIIVDLTNSLSLR
jgi:hypothetical protein